MYNWCTSSVITVVLNGTARYCGCCPDLVELGLYDTAMTQRTQRQYISKNAKAERPEDTEQMSSGLVRDVQFPQYGSGLRRAQES